MNPYKLYIQQTSYDGVEYTSGLAQDTLAQWYIVCAESPFRPYGDPKEVSSREWLDEHGKDVYIPSDVKYKSFDAEVTFLCTGIDTSLKENVRDFFNFLTGKSSRVAPQPIGARLAIYDTFNGMGWKDVRVKSFSPEALLMYDQEEAILRFKVIFEVCDPYTEVYLTGSGSNKKIEWQS